MQFVCKNEGMNFTDGLQVPEGPEGADNHHVALYLGNCSLWNRFCTNMKKIFTLKVRDFEGVCNFSLTINIRDTVNVLFCQYGVLVGGH